MTNALAYLRISRDKTGAGLGVERQRADVEALAERLGWHIVTTYVDNDLSAHSGKRRPAYEDMCEALRNGDATAVLCWHTDRLHRRVAELLDFIRLCQDHEVSVQTVRAGHLDLSTASGRTHAMLGAVLANHEVEHSIERMRAAKEKAAVGGAWLGGPRPFGFKHGGMDHEPVEAAALRDAVARILSGVTLSAIVRDWNGRGIRTVYGNTWKLNSLRYTLMRPRIAGLSAHHGKVVGQGSWEPIIDPDDHAALCAMLRDPSRNKAVSNERRWQGSGVYLCGQCDGPMRVAATAKKARVYRCGSGAHVSRNLEALDAYVDSLVLARLSQPDARLLGADDGGIDAPALQVQRDGLQARLDELAGMFAEGAIDGQQLRRGTESLRAQVEVIDRQLAEARTTSPLTDLVLSVDEVGERWAALSADLRGKVIGTLMTVRVLPIRSGRRGFDPSGVKIEWKS